jgi:hypothetical protein
MSHMLSCSSAVGIATVYTLEDGGIIFQVPESQEFLFLHIIHIRSRVHPNSNQMGNWELFPGVKRQGREAEHWPEAGADGQKLGSIYPLPHKLSWPSA